jgi:hypothetical protein
MNPRTAEFINSMVSVGVVIFVCLTAYRILLKLDLI